MWLRRLLPVFLMLFFFDFFVGCAFGVYMQPQDVVCVLLLGVFFGMSSLFCYLFGVDTPYDSYTRAR